LRDPFSARKKGEILLYSLQGKGKSIIYIKNRGGGRGIKFLSCPPYLKYENREREGFLGGGCGGENKKVCSLLLFLFRKGGHSGIEDRASRGERKGAF